MNVNFINYYDFSFFINEKKEVVKIDQNLLNYLKSKLSTKRLKHSISVANLMYEIALDNCLENPIKFYFCGLIHDIAKEMNKEELTFIMNKEFKEYLNLPFYCYHAFVGAYLVEKELNLKDVEILNAIKFHTTGKKEMDILSIVLYAADKIEPTRGYDSSFLIKKMKENYYEGFILTLKENRKFLSMREVEDNYLSNSMYKYFLK